MALINTLSGGILGDSDLAKKIKNLEKRIAELEAANRSAVMFGRSYSQVGNTNSDLLMKTKGLVKIQWGSKFIDLIKDGKINAESKFIYKEKEVGHKDGIYVVGEGEKQKVVLVIGDTIIDLQGEVGNTYVSFLAPQETTSENKLQALENIGFFCKDLSSLNSIKDGVVYVESEKTLYLILNGNPSKFHLDLPNPFTNQFVIAKDTNEIGSLVIKGKGINNSIAFDSLYIYSDVNDSIISSKENLQININGEKSLVLSDSYSNFLRSVIAPEFKSDGANNIKGFKLYTIADKSCLEVDRIILRDQGITIGNYIEGFSGAKIDGSGNAELESLEVRSYLKVLELVYNRLNALEGNTSFADVGTIDQVYPYYDPPTNLSDNASEVITSQQEESANSLSNPALTKVKAVMRKKSDTDFTAFQYGDIIYGVINELTTEGLYCKVWGLVVGVDRENNTLVIQSYNDGDIEKQEIEQNKQFNPIVRNGMIITRWGNVLPANEITHSTHPSFIEERTDENGNTTYVNTRQSSFYISCEDGNIVQLLGVDKPKIESKNFGAVIGKIPEGLLPPGVEAKINKDHPYIYARGAIIQDLIRIKYEGADPAKMNYRGKWDMNIIYLHHDAVIVTRDGVDTLWYCIKSLDEPDANGKVLNSDSGYPPPYRPDNNRWINITAKPDVFLYSIFPIGSDSIIGHVDKSINNTPNTFKVDVYYQSSDGSVLYNDDTKLTNAKLSLQYSKDSGITWESFTIDNGFNTSDINGPVRIKLIENGKERALLHVPYLKDGNKGDWVTYVYKKSDITPDTPTGDSPNPTGWMDYPNESTGKWWMSKGLVDGATDKVKGNWSIPIQVTGQAGPFKSTVFIRLPSKPPTPSGGTYENPIPISIVNFENGRDSAILFWYDNIPNGLFPLWASSCTFNSDGTDSGWSDPVQMTDTTTYNVEFSDVENPGTPSTNPSNWFDPDKDKNNKDFTKMLWRAEKECKNGTWSDWTIVRIKGENGKYTEFRYAKSTDPKTAPSVENTNINPPNWSITIPTVNKGEYLWMICADKLSSTRFATQDTRWSTPVRISGEAGEVGKTAPIMVFRGEYNANTKYYGNDSRVDAVKYNSAYYIAKSNAPNGGEGFVGKSPNTESDYWKNFGESFDSIATGLLLAEKATIGNWFIQGNNIVSTHGLLNGHESTSFNHEEFKPDIILNGADGSILFYGDDYPKILIVNDSISNLINEKVLNDINIIKTKQNSTGGTYLPSTTIDYEMNYFNLYEETLVDLKAEHNIIINSASVGFNVPYYDTGQDGVTMTIDKATIIIKKWDVNANTYTDVKTFELNYGNSNGSSGSRIYHEINTPQTYIIPKGEDGNYMIVINLDKVRVRGNKTGIVLNFNIDVKATGKILNTKLNRTIIGNDGIGSTWGSSTFIYSKDLFIVRFGSNAFKVSKDGIQYSTNADNKDITFNNFTLP